MVLSWQEILLKYYQNVLKGSVLDLVSVVYVSEMFFISVVYILRDRGQNYLIVFGCILRGKVGGKTTKRSRENL